MFIYDFQVVPDSHLQIGSLLYERLDQIDLTGPFEAVGERHACRQKRLASCRCY